MYNSMASSQEAGSKGSTRLHMDMADAFNVMLYASSCADGSPGYAAWDLYRAEDSDKIREFLRKKFTSGSAAMAAVTNGRPLPTQVEKAAALQNQAIAIHDPIHSQHFTLMLSCGGSYGRNMRRATGSIRSRERVCLYRQGVRIRFVHFLLFTFCG
jgi:lysine-specific demethylase 3